MVQLTMLIIIWPKKEGQIAVVTSSKGNNWG
jgi:hypothetical protein